MIKVVMPKLGMMRRGTVGKWLKKEGDRVEKGEALFEAETEKALVEVEAQVSGIIQKILVPEGKEICAGEQIAIISEMGERPSIEEPILTQKIASPPSNEEEQVEIVSMTTMRKTIAERLSQSWMHPHVTMTMDVDMSEMIKARRELFSEIEKSAKIRVSFTDMIVKAVAAALTVHPRLNSTLMGDQIKMFKFVHMGVAVATESGLIVPVVDNANKKTLVEIAISLRKLYNKAKEGRLSLNEVTGGTFTITNLGMYEVDMFTPIVNPPQNAILGVGRIVEKPVGVNGHIVLRPMMTLSLSYDHRVIDGSMAAKFLKTITINLIRPRGIL